MGFAMMDVLLGEAGVQEACEKDAAEKEGQQRANQQTDVKRFHCGLVSSAKERFSYS